ncbi:MAG: mannose-1-phosphate guanylyltransferase/mannose-6-phosphate isomerase [Pseudomonadota bacterium]
MSSKLKIRPVIMSGGAGTRMWPISRRDRPKQFHRILTEDSLFQGTLLRVPSSNSAFLPPVILGAERHKSIILEELMEIGEKNAALILEPMPKNTAPAIAAMAVSASLRSPDEILVVLPADHLIGDVAGFAAALVTGAPYANDGHILTFGVKPSGPETGYGYIQAGSALGDDAYVVKSFEEKPDLATAKKYIASGNYHWNAGIFMFRADVMIAEMKTHCPKTLAAVMKAVEAGETTDHCLLLDADAFDQSIDDSIDYAVMEHTERAAVLPMDVGWSDVGSWAALWEESKKDASGNSGDDAILIDCENTLAISSGPKISAIGVRDLLIVSTPDGVLVSRRDKAQDVKKVIAALKANDRSDLL